MGAQVKIDGEVKGITPLSLSIAGGAHVMEIAAGTEPRVIPITVTAGQTLAQYVELVGVSALGRLSIQSSPVGATVLLDGQPRGVTPLELPDVSAGQHELVLDLKGQRVRQTVSVATGITTAVDLPMTAAPPSRRQACSRRRADDGHGAGAGAVRDAGLRRRDAAWPDRQPLVVAARAAHLRL